MMGHDAARLSTAQRRAVPCRAAHNNYVYVNYWFLIVILDGDVKGLRRQDEEHAGFKHQLAERGCLIRTAIEIGEKLIMVNPTRQDFTDCLETLDTEWRELLERSSEWQDDIVRMMENVKAYEDQLKELNKL